MANDYKRMWTREELEDTYKLDLSEVKEIDDVKTIYISKKEAFEIGSHNHILVKNDSSYILLSLAQKDVSTNYTNWVYNSTAGNSISIIDETSELYCLSLYRTIYVDSISFDALTRVTPTDVSIIEDQGKLELLLEHDSHVLAVNDTPNQFLQRRLDKPSAEWFSETSPEDFETWLLGKPFHEGQIIYLNYGEGGGWFIKKGIKYMALNPQINSTIFSGTNIILDFALLNNAIEFRGYNLSSGVAEVVTFSFNDIIEFKIF